MAQRHVLSTKQFTSQKELDNLFKIADKFRSKKTSNKLLSGKILAALFYEPSTRTRFSFESAMLRLGGSVISTENATTATSASKGESLADSAKVVSSYADIIVIRHPQVGAAKITAENATVPVINAGDGAGEHPTQALLDLYTIKRELKKTSGLNIALIGDLKNGRTVHSLAQLLNIYKNNSLTLIAPNKLKFPDEYKKYLLKKGIKIKESQKIEDSYTCDALYVTRVQKERFTSSAEYNKIKDTYIINSKTMKNLKKNAIVMHPLPRVNEISEEVDKDKRAAYFRQAENGLYIRMALLKTLLK